MHPEGRPVRDDPATPGHLTHTDDGTGTGNGIRAVLATALEAATLAGELPMCCLETLPFIPPDSSGT